MKLNIFKDADEAIVAIADYFITVANEAIQQNGSFNVSLSGGSSPKKLFELLASDALKNKIAWEKVYFFFGDERYVAHDHPDSNYLMAYKALFAPLSIGESQIFKVDTGLDPASAALNYEKCISQHFKDEPVFDLILLGLGDDAHTASLFPGTSVLWIDEELVKDVYLQDKAVYRITMTAPLINKAKNIAFLTFGNAKADAIKAVLKGERDITKYPAQLINPVNGDLQWFIDEAAAAKLG
ncbi:6-phosphogluconolactonase [Pedobacter glucosidilyticus]|mgnify:CR=1 FL=1|uniref:6-phosphogluconolactonase n=1 Tax=Pedobacter glucosidilyticus TaxID=1122941 RepID=UPI000402FF14|nr:6-phosphogluconolactonase [Pedobacter glucosidilyticus]